MSARRFLPVFRLPVLAIGREDTPAHLHRIDIEMVVTGILHRKPYILHRVLPVGTRATPFLALPCDAVENGETLFDDTLHGRRATPVAAHIEAAVWFQLVAKGMEPAAEIILIVG